MLGAGCSVLNHLPGEHVADLQREHVVYTFPDGLDLFLRLVQAHADHLLDKIAQVGLGHLLRSTTWYKLNLLPVGEVRNEGLIDAILKLLVCQRLGVLAQVRDNLPRVRVKGFKVKLVILG